jgi:hypothetical protein
VTLAALCARAQRRAAARWSHLHGSHPIRHGMRFALSAATTEFEIAEKANDFGLACVERLSGRH